ncbi:hypothetical protein C8A05DRAFT_19265 [Staphylotrichum tortipilum]|uniref:Uncharacterized protein n=1 Tax=Staphylotrichum tortipilum TaxID=2831512 RepID=A0AAN6MC03_9PEZI|nr:hypothetical protein C8A05DRAFT_19265 [Staphylotrichum longicolle]
MLLPPPSPPPAPPPPTLFPPTHQPPTTTTATTTATTTLPTPPPIPTTAPPNTLLVSLLVYNGWPFADHWEYFVSSPADPEVGVVVQAAGDVRGGFWLEVKRGWRVGMVADRGGGVRRVGLGWVGEEYFRGDGDAGLEKLCGFEGVLFRARAPGKTLRSVDGKGGATAGRERITQRNCQTWVVEAAEEGVKEGIWGQEVVDYLRGASMMDC